MNPNPRRRGAIRGVAATTLGYAVGVGLGAAVGGFVGWGAAGRANELTGVNVGSAGPVLGAVALPGLVVRRLWAEPGEGAADFGGA